MTCPLDCTRPESPLAKDSSSPTEKSRYFTGISPAVVFVASLSFLAFFTVAMSGLVVATTQFIFFVALPLASAAGGAFLVAAPETTLLGSDASVLLLLRAAGAIAIAYAGSAMLVGRSKCSGVRSAYLVLVAGSLGAMTAAFAMDEGSALVAAGVGRRAAAALGKLAVTAAAGAVMSAAGPRMTKKIQSGKPGEPGLLCFG